MSRFNEERIIAVLKAASRELVSTGFTPYRLLTYARYNWLLLAEGHLTRRLLGGRLTTGRAAGLTLAWRGAILD